MDKQALQWVRRMHKAAADDSTRPGIYRKACKVSAAVWVVTNGHYALFAPTPAGLVDWARDLEAPKTGRRGVDLDRLLILAEAGETLPSPDTLQCESVYPQVEFIVKGCDGREPVCNLDTVLAEVEGEFSDAQRLHAPTTAQRMAAANRMVPHKLPPKGARMIDHQLRLWPRSGDWTFTVETLTVNEAGGCEWDRVELGRKPKNADTCGRPIGLDLRYLKLAAAGGAWQSGEWNPANPAVPVMLRWGREAFALMPMRL